MKKHRTGAAIIGILLGAFCVLPFLYVLGRSFWSARGFTLEYFYDVFLRQSQFLLRFWKSLALSGAIALGQTCLAILAGYGFAKCRFPGRNQIFFLLIIWMIIPIQVTLVPNYFIFDKLGLLGTYFSLALPGIFLPLGTFIMTQSFRAVPNDILEAAQLDGARTPTLILRMLTPMSKSGVVCTLLLSFLDAWNMVEQPIAFLRDVFQYPLSVALASVPPGDPNVQLVCCVLTALPSLVLFALFHREMAEGIELGGNKTS